MFSFTTVFRMGIQVINVKQTVKDEKAKKQYVERRLKRREP